LILINRIVSLANRDKQKERSRQTKLTVYKETGEWPGKQKRPNSGDPKKIAWSEKMSKKERKRKRKEVKEKRKHKQNEVEVEDLDNEDNDDLEEDYRLIKKMRKGKVSL